MSKEWWELSASIYTHIWGSVICDQVIHLVGLIQVIDLVGFALDIVHQKSSSLKLLAS